MSCTRLLLLTALGLNLCTVLCQTPRLVRQLLPHYTLSPSDRFSDCSFTGTQLITVNWYRQGTRLPTEPSGGPYSSSEGVLVLENAGPEDSGNYTCTGSNSLGTTSVYTTISIEAEEPVAVARSWFMMFVYAVLVWLVGSTIITIWFCYQHRRAERNKPPPVDRNECFAIDHEGVMVPEHRPRSRVSGDYTVFGSGYPNPAFTGPTTHKTAITEQVDSRDGTVTKTVLTTEREYYYIPPVTGITAGRNGSRRDSGTRDARLQLIEQEETVIA